MPLLGPGEIGEVPTGLYGGLSATMEEALEELGRFFPLSKQVEEEAILQIKEGLFLRFCLFAKEFQKFQGLLTLSGEP